MEMYTNRDEQKITVKKEFPRSEKGNEMNNSVSGQAIGSESPSPCELPP